MNKRIINNFYGDVIHQAGSTIDGDIVMGNIIIGNKVVINGRANRRGFNMIQASDNIQTIEIESKGQYYRIENDSLADIEYYESDEESITLTVPENLTKYFKVEQTATTLSVSMDSNVSFSCGYDNRPHLLVKHKGLKELRNSGSSNVKLHGNMALENIYTSGSGDIDAFDTTIESQYFYCQISGSGDIKGQTIHSNKIEISISGSGDVRIEDIDAQGVAVSIRGAGDVSVNGKTKLVKFNIAGSGDISASGLEAEIGSAHIMGAGDISCNVKQLTKSIMGAGDIRNCNQSASFDVDDLWDKL